MKARLQAQLSKNSSPWKCLVAGAIAGVVFVVAVILLDKVFMKSERMISYTFI